MLAKDKDTVSCIRQIMAEISRYEIDVLNREPITDEQCLEVLVKMLKQRKESLEIYEKESREDLASKERLEIDVIQKFMPEPLSEDELSNIINEAVSNSGASSIKDMGKVMSAIRPLIQGRADMKVVSQKIKDTLANK